MSSHTTPVPPEQQRQDLLDAERRALSQQDRGFKDDALTDKIVHVEPDGTGPSSPKTLDPDTDQKAAAPERPAAPSRP